MSMRFKKIVLCAVFLAVASLAFVVVAPAVKAETCTDHDTACTIALLQRQIAALQAQLQALQNQQGGTGSTIWCHTFNTNLGYAQSGTNEIKSLHIFLRKEGFSYAPDDETSYTEATGHAIVEFQTKYGILATGYVGLLSRYKMNKLDGCPTSTQPSITVTSPNGGEAWKVGETRNITWTSSNVDKVVIQLINPPNITPVATIATGISASSGSYSWVIPSTINPANSYQIMISNYNGVGALDVSDSTFSIVASTSTNLLAVSKNTAYGDQTASPNMAAVKIGSFIAQNQSTSHSINLTSLTIGVGGTASITNFAALRTSITSGSGSTPIQPTASNTFSIAETLTPGQTKVIDIFADSSTQTGVNVITTLAVTSTDLTTNTSSTTPTVTGQTITFSTGMITGGSIVTSSSTPAQYIAAGMGGSINATKATYNFVSNGGASTITELKFTVTGTNTVTRVCIGTVCASPVSGTAYLTGLNLSVPNGGGGLTIDALVSYSEVSTNGIVPGTTSSIALTSIKYTSGGETHTVTSINISAPTMTMVASKPTLIVNSTPNQGLILGAENKIGEVTIFADAGGKVKINDIRFNLGWVNISNLVVTNARIADGTTTITGSGCGQNASTIFCEFGSSGNTVATGTTASNVESDTDFDGYVMPAGTSKTFSLYATVNGTRTNTSNAISISSSIDAAGFNWDDASYATFVGDGTSASPSAGTNLTGFGIYNFPTSSYTISDTTGGGGAGTLNTPTFVAGMSTPAKNITVGSTGAQNATDATYSFLSTGGNAIVKEVKFTVTGSDGNPSNTVTSICLDTNCAVPVAGVAYITGISFAPQDGVALTRDFSISYTGVGQNGIASGTTSAVSLSYVKYIDFSSGVGVYKTMTPFVSAPTMTLVSAAGGGLATPSPSPSPTSSPKPVSQINSTLLASIADALARIAEQVRLLLLNQ